MAAISGATAAGYITNLSVFVGDYVRVGEASMALVDSGSFYVNGYFEETRLPLRVNVLSLAIFVAACGLVTWVAPRGVDAVLSLFAVLLGATLSRNLLLRRAVQRRAPEVFA